MSRKYIKNCTGENCEMEKAQQRFAPEIIFYVLFALFVAVLAYMLFFSQYLEIKNITILGTKELSTVDIQAKINGILEGKYVKTLPKNNFIFISPRNIEEELRGNFKKIRTVQVMKKFPDTLEITIDERKALLVWCSTECYLLDENGTAYSKADFSSQELLQNNLLQINDGSGREITIGNKVIDKNYEQYILAIKDALSSIGFVSTGIYQTPSRMAEELIVTTVQDLEFYFSTQFPLDVAIKNTSTLLKKEIPAEKVADLAYIDLRNENKVFYKFKDVQVPITENIPEGGVSTQKEEKK
jgi:cell division septal protein FtsQ